MNTTTAIGGLGRGESMRLRMSSLLLAFALTAGSLLMVANRADAAPRPAVATAASAVNAQIDLSAIACAILIPLRNAFAGSPFFGFLQPFFTQLLVSFGCQPSG